MAIIRDVKIRELHRQTWVEQSPEEVFAFFSQTDNLLKVTPPSIPVTIKQQNITIELGTVVDLKMRLFGFLPVRWQTKIIIWEPPHRFVDSQPRGPYRFWEHSHQFEARDGGTMITDHLRYAVPGWIFEPLIHQLFVKRTLYQLFDYRQQQYVQLLTEK